MVAGGGVSLEASTTSTSSELNVHNVQLRGSSQGRGNAESMRRWHLLRTHVSTLTQERKLRRQLWGSAVSLARSQHSGGGHKDKLVWFKDADADDASAAASKPCSEPGDHTSSSSTSCAESPESSLKGKMASRREASFPVGSWNL
jgi:hypothetical protein